MTSNTVRLNSGSSSKNKTPQAAFAIRTMRDDLESIKNGEQESLPSQPSETTYQTQNANQSLNKKEENKEEEKKDKEEPVEGEVVN